MLQNKNLLHLFKNHFYSSQKIHFHTTNKLVWYCTSALWRLSHVVLVCTNMKFGLHVKPGTDLCQGCRGAMCDADLTMYTVLCAEANYTPIQLALMDRQPMDRVAHRAEADCATPHNLRTCPHLRSAPCSGCFSVVRCASVPSCTWAMPWVFTPIKAVRMYS